MEHFDGAIYSRWHIEHGHLVRRETQPAEHQILDFNAELRKNPGALRHMSFMGLALQIPEIHLRILWKKYPELKSVNADERTAAWKRFIKSSEADPYRVRPRQRKPRINHGP